VLEPSTFTVPESCAMAVPPQAPMMDTANKINAPRTVDRLAVLGAACTD
jgi:hypothetical protein